MQQRTCADRPAVITALIILFLFGTAMTLLAAVTLLFPESTINIVWRLNPAGHQGFLRMGNWSFVLLGAVALMCSAAAIGLWSRKAWGYWLGLSLIVANLIGDIANVAMGKEYRAALGIPVAFAILFFLTRSKTRGFFVHRRSHETNL